MPNVPYNIVSKYKKKYEDIDARPIKKVVEAQARKKRRVSQKLLFFFLTKISKTAFLLFQMSKKLDRARKKAEVISDNLDMTDKERSREIKSVYKRAGLLSAKVNR